MKTFLVIFTCCLLAYLIFFGMQSNSQPTANVWKLPLMTPDRQDWSTLFFEPDAHFKALRAPFGPVKLHYHTGIDLQNSEPQIPGVPIYPIAAGKVIAIEDPLPQRRITIEHNLPDGSKVWSVYIHVSNEQVAVGDMVDTETVIAYLMSGSELAVYGKEFDHVHLEIMKQMPDLVSEYHQRKTFTCYTENEVDEYFYNPEEFLKRQLAQ